ALPSPRSPGSQRQFRVESCRRCGRSTCFLTVPLAAKKAIELDQGSVHQRRQIECQLWKEHQEHDHQQHAENEGYGSDHDLVEAPAFAHSLYYIEIEADRR